MRAYIAILVLCCILTFGATKYFTKPETVVVTQEKIIYKLKKDIEVQKIEANARYILRIPFTQIGITKDGVLGMGIGYLIAVL